MDTFSILTPTIPAEADSNTVNRSGKERKTVKRCTAPGCREEDGSCKEFDRMMTIYHLLPFWIPAARALSVKHKFWRDVM